MKAKSPKNPPATPAAQNKKHPAKSKMIIRKRKNTTVTLSDEVKRMGGILAHDRGIPFARLVETLLRTELRRAGLLKPEGLS